MQNLTNLIVRRKDAQKIAKAFNYIIGCNAPYNFKLYAHSYTCFEVDNYEEAKEIARELGITTYKQA